MSVWVELVRRCIVERESGGDYTIRSHRTDGAGHYAYGAYQFQDRTFKSVTGLSGHANTYPKSMQDAAFFELFDNGNGKSHWYLKGATKQCW